jgi:hypothetical protein
MRVVQETLAETIHQAVDESIDAAIPEATLDAPPAAGAGAVGHVPRPETPPPPYARFDSAAAPSAPSPGDSRMSTDTLHGTLVENSLWAGSMREPWQRASAMATLIALFEATHRSARELQTFYAPEYDHALAACPALDDDAPSACLSTALEWQFTQLRQVSAQGTRMRTVRDVLSLTASVSLLTGVAMQIAKDSADAGLWDLGAYHHANMPYGNARASWTLTGIEIGKAGLTSALTYLTMPEHHLVDERIKRYELTMNALVAALQDLDPGIASVFRDAGHISPAGRASHFASEAGRHLSTVFTLINHVLAPIRVALFTTDRIAQLERLEPVAWRAPVMGLLRVTSSVSDTLRALLSQLGTHARQRHFDERMKALLAQAKLLDALVDNVTGYPLSAARVQRVIDDVTTTGEIASNDVLDQYAHDKTLRRVIDDVVQFGAGSVGPLSLAPHALGWFDVKVGVAARARGSGHPYRLYASLPEDHWGRDPNDRWRALTAIRTVYRISLTLQAIGAKLIAGLANRIACSTRRPTGRRASHPTL